MTTRRAWRLFLTALLLGYATSTLGEPRLATSIAPVHSLVAGVSGERAQPHLLVPGGRSPHTYALAPTDARALAQADAVFTSGGPADAFLQRPLRAFADGARIVRMSEVDGIRRLSARGGGAWRTHAGHDHEDPEHGDEQGDGDGAGHDHAHDDTATLDPHLWLDPRNAIAFTRAVADTLAAIDPDHAGHYRTNADAQIERLRALDARLNERLAPIADRPYLVFHDAYQYFERRYGLSPAGAIAVDPGRPPGARRVAELRERINALGARCLFTEPQFEPRIARVVADGTEIRLGTLDPLGAELDPGVGLYDELLTRLAESLRSCLDSDAVGKD